MPDNVDPATRSRTMAQVPSKDTRPEMAVRRAVHAAGHRYQLHRADLPGKPDLVFPRHRLAVFVHGCFWHRHSCRKGSSVPATRTTYWLAKFKRNKSRDRRARDSLRRLGWRSLVVWECQLGDAARLERALRRFLG